MSSRFVQISTNGFSQFMFWSCVRNQPIKSYLFVCKQKHVDLRPLKGPPSDRVLGGGGVGACSWFLILFIFCLFYFTKNRYWGWLKLAGIVAFQFWLSYLPLAQILGEMFWSDFIFFGPFQIGMSSGRGPPKVVGPRLLPCGRMRWGGVTPAFENSGKFGQGLRFFLGTFIMFTWN